MPKKMPPSKTTNPMQDIAIELMIDLAEQEQRGSPLQCLCGLLVVIL